MTRISHLTNEDDIHISILQFLQSRSTPAIEISHITAAENTSIEINQFFHRSPDYLNLLTKIRAAESVLGPLPAGSEAYKTQMAALQDLYRLEKAFKIDVLHLADLFLRIDVKSERVTKARALFEEGRFREADDLLREEDLTKDQNDLLVAVDYLERRQADILNLIASKLNKS